ncbi:MAG: ATP-binding protein [Actinomycetota bacterium]
MLRRVDSAIPLVIKVGLPMLAVGALTVMSIASRLNEVAGGRSPEDALKSVAVGLGATAASLILVLYFFVFRRTSRLSRVAKRLAQGDLDVRLPEGEGQRGHDALYNFCWAFDRMVRQLDKRAGSVAEAEQRYRSMVERIPAVAYTAELTGEGKWTYVAPQIEAILGYSAEEWKANPALWSRQLHEEDRPMIMARIEGNRRRPEDRMAMEYRLLARDGRVVWVHDEAVVVNDASGRAQELQGVLYDVTERKEAEDTLQQAYDREVQAAARLRSVDEMKNAFLTAVSHELRTPLASVLGYGITLAQPNVDLPEEERQDMLERLVRNARRLETLLGDLLDMDRMSRGILEPRLHPTDLAELARRVLDNANLRDRAIIEDIEQVVVEVDAPMVERILENLLMNAGKHTPSGSPVRLAIQRVEDGAVIAVDDQGPGVPDPLKESVFLPFERGPESPDHAPGTGIGLSLVARFAELHGGRAWVDDAPGGGASFRVFLPAVHVDQESDWSTTAADLPA